MNGSGSGGARRFLPLAALAFLAAVAIFARSQSAARLELGRPAPPITVDRWRGSPPLDPPALRGKVVLLDFWGVWCRPCVAAIPKVNALHDKFREKGLIVIGIHTTEGAVGFEEGAAKAGIRYPTCVDVRDETNKRYGVSMYPTCVLVDRRGNVRDVDFDPENEAAIERLLAEP